MKKIISLLLVALMLSSIVGCSKEKKPRDDLPTQAVEAGLEAINILQQLIDGTMDVDIAYDMLDAIYDRLDRFSNSLNEDDLITNIEVGRICTYILSARIELIGCGSWLSDTTKSDIQGKLDDLKELIYNK